MQLTAVAPAERKVGERAVERLMGRIRDPDRPFRPELIVPRLIIQYASDAI